MVTISHSKADEKEFGYLLRFLQLNKFNVIMVEGQRGVGKTSFVNRLLASTNIKYYKTWGKGQKSDRFAMTELGLDLPQATYFILDYLTQIPPSTVVVCDRAVLSALAYQSRQYLFGKSNLHKYYVELMESSNSVMLLLETDEKEIVSRRIKRGVDDEQKLCTLSDISAERYVKKDSNDYARAIEAMEKAGLKCAVTYELDAALCNCYVPSDVSNYGLPLESPTDEDTEDS